MVQWDWQHLGSSRMWVRSPAQHSGLQHQCCRSCGLGCIYGSDLISGPRTPYTLGQPKKKKKKELNFDKLFLSPNPLVEGFYTQHLLICQGSVSRMSSPGFVSKSTVFQRALGSDLRERSWAKAERQREQRTAMTSSSLHNFL